MVDKVKKEPNYTESQVATLVEAYKAKPASVSNAEFCAEWGKTLNKPPRSIVSKLSRESVYVAEPKGAKKAVKDDGPSKKDLFAKLDSAGFSSEGLDGATKAAIQRVLDLQVAFNALTVDLANPVDEEMAEAA
jgi:hypothetical protein